MKMAIFTRVPPVVAISDWVVPRGNSEFFHKNESYSMLINIDAYTQILEHVTVIGWEN